MPHTNEPSMVARGGNAAGRGYTGPSAYNNNESGDQVLFRSDGFDNNPTSQHSRFYNQTKDITSHSNKYSAQYPPRNP